MKFFVLALALFSAPAHAELTGMLVISSDSSLAKLILTEGKGEGELSHLFDRLGGSESREGLSKTKTFALSSGRFAYSCKKFFPPTLPATTSCTWTIRAGENSSDLRTTLTKSPDRKVALIEMSAAFAQELDQIFPGDANGMVNLLVKASNDAAFEVRGSSRGEMKIELSSK